MRIFWKLAHYGSVIAFSVYLGVLGHTIWTKEYWILMGLLLVATVTSNISRED